MSAARPGLRSYGRGQGIRMTSKSPHLTNIRKILRLEREKRGDPSLLDWLTDGVSRMASGAGFVVVHMLWFLGWMLVNSRRGASFDPYPYNLLTLAVSLEAIILTGFVLRAQGRMALQADRRA